MSQPTSSAVSKAMPRSKTTTCGCMPNRCAIRTRSGPHVATRIDWITAPTQIKDTSFALDDFHIRWYADGVLNASVNCLDRHLAARGDKTALIFERDDPALPAEHITYRDLHARVCRLANALRHLGVGKGDRVTIYLPMIPEAVVAMLACARIGAIHMVVFGGFAPQSIADRIADCGSRLIITADEGLRGGGASR